MEWDAEKDADNLRKHGLALGDAVLLDWDVGKEAIDRRQEYGEVRWVRHALIGDRLHICVYVVRAGTRRIISLRKANKREILNYGV